MLNSIYNFIQQLVGHTWQYYNSSITYQEQPYLYFSSCIIIILLVVVSIDLIYRLLANIFNFRL